eukprot:gb/GECH01008692.1/.p1 GENE.gb/GECH01008692.1/~~gb/GECH01008692.1/.p1  ORF type:complete len:380 (+),score=24.87 gb/GECH01008692.1/:1-1140(+)
MSKTNTHLFTFILFLFVSFVYVVPFSFCKPERELLELGQPKDFYLHEGYSDITFFLSSVNNLRKSNDTLHISVSYYSGSGDFYVSLDNGPTPKQYMWKSKVTKWGEYVSISGDDPNYKPNKMFNIKVDTPAKEDTHFRIFAYTNKDHTSIEENDLPLLSVLPKNTFTYFSFIPKEYGFNVSAIPRVGGIGAGDQRIYVARGRIPTRMDYDWASTRQTDSVVVSNHDVNFKPYKFYEIGIFNNAQTTISTVGIERIRTPPKGITLLENGNSVKGKVEYRNYTYYQFNVPEDTHQTLTIDLTPDQYVPCAADLFMSFFWTRPTKKQYAWSEVGKGKKQFTLKGNDPNFKPDGMFHIGVYGNTYCEYSLVANYGTSNRIKIH